MQATTNIVRLPWFRVHLVILNDPGRLISVHIMHTALVSGWAGVMSLYELVIIDPSDMVYNPLWRQGCYVIPCMSRLGVTRSSYEWSLGVANDFATPYWSYETVSIAHLLLCGFAILASFWHWAYWDLDVFTSSTSGMLVLDLYRIFGIHLSLSSLLCFGFGLGHLTGFFGPGLWTSDSFGIVGSIRYIKPLYSLSGLSPFCYGVLASHHISAGLLGLCIGVWHLSTRPGPRLYSLLSSGNIEVVLSSSLAAVLFSAFVSSSFMWYGSVSTAIELFGPSRFHWDNGYFASDIERRVNTNTTLLVDKAFQQVPDKLVVYDYIGCNPAKGGLFRSGPEIKGDGVVQNWLGHALFEQGTLPLSVRRMPAFFETFPVILIDQGGVVRADIPFRRAESRYSLDQTNVVLYFLGGVLSGTEYSTPKIVNDYARKAQFGEILYFEKTTSQADGVFRTSVRGWFSLSHVALSFIFLFGHLWHAGRVLFRDIWTGVGVLTPLQVEYGRNEKLGDDTTKASSI